MHSAHRRKHEAQPGRARSAALSDVRWAHLRGQDKNIDFAMKERAYETGGGGEVGHVMDEILLRRVNAMVYDAVKAGEKWEVKRGKQCP